jgi:Fur family ferric uptake transcriptional regulator
MSILEETGRPLSPQTIHQRASQTDENISLVSVYRTLDLLNELDLVCRVHGQDECQGYVLSSPGHHHQLICRNCQKTVEFSGSTDLEPFIEAVEQQTGFLIDGHLLQLFGLCPECHKKGN